MSNYKAIIAKVDKTLEIPKADKIHIAKVLGESVIVSKEVGVGYVGVFFCAGTQLSEEFCSDNNLFRHSYKNKDVDKSGFFEDNRRVRAQPFLKVKSEGFFVGLESLTFTGADISSLKVGDQFEELNGVRVCNKYINPRTKTGNTQKSLKKKVFEDFKEHVNTAQFKYNINNIEKGDLISIQSKVHGTSARYGYLNGEVDLPLWKRLVNKFLKVFPTKEYNYVVGTRRVVLANPEKEGFHGKEGYRFEIMEELKPYLSKGMTVYGEIAGYANGNSIMSVHSTKSLKDKKFTKKYGDNVTYKYGCLDGEYRFHVYRITLTTDDGTTIDFTQKQLVDWCNERNILSAFDIVEPFVYDGDSEKLLELVDKLTERDEVLTEDYHDPSHVSEGVIVRVDKGTTTPLFLKNKSYAFKVMEGIASEKTVEVEDEA